MPATTARLRPATITTVALMLALAVVLAACRPLGLGRATDTPNAPVPGSTTREGAAISAVTSINVLADLIAQVGGERVDVKALVPIGADPRTFQPMPRDVQTIADANIVILNGLGLEESSLDAFREGERPAQALVTLSEGLETLPASDGQAGADANPHLWLDPRNTVRYVERIRDGLARVDPAGAALYEANARSYLERLRTLDAEVDGQISAIPADRRKLVTVYDAFAYLARRYGFERVAVALKAPGREPSAQEVAELSTAIRAAGVPTVYTEPHVSSRILKLAARDAGLRISTLYSNTLDEHVPSYEALVRYNARQLVDGLKP